MELFRWLLLNGEMEKDKKSKFKNSVNAQKQPLEIPYKKTFS